MKVKGFDDTIKWYDTHAKEYADSEYANSYARATLQKFIELLPPTPIVLDAGCGAGRDAGIMQQNGVTVTGLDLSQGLLEEAQKRNPKVTFVKGNFLHLPFKEATFDGLWAHAALVHLEEISAVTKALNEFKRVLKSNGILHVYVKAQRGKEKTEVASHNPLPFERFFRYFTKEELDTYVKDAGFTIQESTLIEAKGRTELRWINIFAKKQ